MAEVAKEKKISGKELGWYIVAAVFTLVGLVFFIFGLIGKYYPGKASDNWISISENAWLINWSKMGYRWWGLILIGVGVLIAVIALTVFARVADRDDERNLRRQQRLVLEQNATTGISKEGAVEVKSEDKAAPAPKAPEAK
ncbi:MAG: hypothetical protein BWY98_01198 [Tenericutes bacterium ADurb.BinA155]|jgi:hypothetical protein|nr:MAG: hypothetical protein BWY98_01198 [Tenericutes bacterium ADurb.BinA155]